MKRSLLPHEQCCNQRIPIAVRVNDKSLKFILDTGATFSAISRDAAIKLKLERISTVMINTAGGTIFAPVVKPDLLEIGEKKFKNYCLGISDFLTDGFDGLLGLDILIEFEVTIDLKNGKFILKCHD